MMPSPWALLAALAIVVGAALGGYTAGRMAGVNAQKVADQEAFDEVDQKLAAQKAEASAAYRAFQEHNIALVVERDQLKTNLEKRHAQDAAATDADRRQFAGLGLRFAAAENAGCGDRRLGAGSAEADAARTDAAAAVELPATITSDLRQLVFEADQLADSYRECYGYAVED